MVAGTLTYSTKMDTGGLQKGVSTIKSIVVGLGIDKILSKAFDTINASLDGAINRLDTLNNFPKVMSNMGISADESKEAIDDLAQRLKGIPTTLDDAVMSVERFTSKNGDVKKSVDIFDAVNNAILAGGASADIQKSALEQLSQAYSKGKPDMMEWRTIQMAMPAQLNQIANAMGKTTDALGEDLRSGKISMNDFIDTIIKLNKEGSNGFQSFEQQAKNSTGGIKTSIATAKTAVTRGVANIIQSINEGLKSAGIENGIGQIFTEIGSKMESALNYIGEIAKKYLPPIIEFAVSAFNYVKERLQEILPPIIERVKDTITKIINYIKNANFKKTFENIKNIAQTVFKAILNSIKPIYEFVKKNILPIFQNLFKALKNKIDTTNFEKLRQTIQRLAPLVSALVAGFVAFKTIKFVTEVIEKIKKSLQVLFATISTHPLAAALVVITSLIAALVTLSKMESDAVKSAKEESQAIKDQSEEIKRNVDAWKEREQSARQTISAGKEEVENYKNLYDELTRLVDENGKVKEGYEDRASFIVTTLSDALGIEMDLVDGVVKGYKDLVGSIDKLIEKKKAQIILDSQEDLYSEAIKNESDAIIKLSDKYKEWTDNTKKLNDAQEELSGIRENLDKLNNHEIYLSGKQVAEMSTRQRELESLISTYKENDKTLEDSYNNQLDLVQRYAYDRNVYEKNMVLAQEGNYNDMITTNYDYYKRYQDFTDADKAMLQDEINARQLHMDKLIEMNKDKNDEIINAQIVEEGMEIANLKSHLAEVEQKWDTSLDKQLSLMTGAQVEFRDAGDGQVQAYINGVAVGQPKATGEMKKLAENAIQQVTNQKGNADLAGQGLVEGVGNGIGNNAKQSTVFSRIASFGSNLLQTLRNSLEEHSPSKASYKMAGFLLEGFDNGIEDNQKNVLKTIDSFGNEVINRMSNAVELETGKINAKASISSNINKVIQINADFKGNVELDNRKVGRIIAPNVAQTIKAGGL